MAEKEYIITVEMLKELDELYENTEDITPQLKRHPDWGILVEELRDIRRRIEAGVTVRIEGTDTALTDWSGFYEWAHGRYHALEDGYDRWIGDNN
ncbi:MAG: hypothetical protein HY867_09535 [Chloroflexi bacterium]|nr:hypothetical protein [Chloroflexota bacterium]